MAEKHLTQIAVFCRLDPFVLEQRIIIDNSNTYEQHKQLAFAKMACENDTECIGVYDEFCDEDGPFLKVKRGFMTSSYSPNCLFKKKQYEGK